MFFVYLWHQLLQIIEKVAQVDAPLPLHIVVEVALLQGFGLAVAARPVVVALFVLSLVLLDPFVLSGAAAILRRFFRRAGGGDSLHGHYGLQPPGEAALHRHLQLTSVFGGRVRGQSAGHDLRDAEFVAQRHHIDFFLCKER